MKLFLSQMVFRCKYCERRFGQQCRLKEHIKCYHEGNVYICHDCKEDGIVKTFNRKDSLVLHITKVHGGVVERVSCDDCGKTFGRKDNLIVHIRNKHGVVERVTCDQCGETFGIKTNLIKHIREKHGDVERVTCDQ